MMAEIKYKMVYMLDPWDEKKREQGLKWWYLCKLVEPELGLDSFATSFEPVAVFNRDSEGSLFQAHLFKGGGVEIDSNQRELCERADKHKKTQ
jgi:hypothetical protein